MKNTKDSKTLLDELKTLLDVRKNLIGTDQINNVIADKAEEFVETLYTEIDDEVKKTFEPSATPKSEMPCNCRQDSREKLALMEMRNAFMKGKKYLLIPLDN